MNEVASGMQKVGFTQASPTVKKQWVIGGTGLFRDLLRCGVYQLVGFALYEVVKAVAPVQASFQWCPARPFLRLEPIIIACTANVDYDRFPWSTQVFKDVAYAFEVIGGYVIANIFIGRLYNGMALGSFYLQRTNPGIEIICWKFSFQVFNTGFPVVFGHSREQSGPVRQMNRESSRSRMVKSNVLWIT